MCDAFGQQLSNAALPVATFTDCHDECAWALFDLVHEAGFHFHLEPRAIFDRQLPTHILTAREKPAIVPDAMGEAAMPPCLTARDAPRARSRLPPRVLLWDVKTIHGGGHWYGNARAREDQSGAVAARAHAVNGGQYGQHAHRLDRLHSPPNTSPIASKLASFSQVRALVFGGYAEASADVHSLIELAAHTLARKHWRQAGARTEAEARSYWVGMCRRRIGVAATRAMALHRIRRSVFVGVARAVLDDRARRGVAAVGDDRAPRDGDLHAFYAHQILVGPHMAD